MRYLVRGGGAEGYWQLTIISYFKTKFKISPTFLSSFFNYNGFVSYELHFESQEATLQTVGPAGQPALPATLLSQEATL